MNTTERKAVDVLGNLASMALVRGEKWVLIHDAVAELIEAANEMMQQGAVQHATEITNPFMAGAADKLASALRKVGAR